MKAFDYYGDCVGACGYVGKAGLPVVKAVVKLVGSVSCPSACPWLCPRVEQSEPAGRRAAPISIYP